MFFRKASGSAAMASDEPDRGIWSALSFHVLAVPFRQNSARRNAAAANAYLSESLCAIIADPQQTVSE